MRSADEYCRKGELKRFPMRSGKVSALSDCPIGVYLLTVDQEGDHDAHADVQSTVSQMMLLAVDWPATPPKPTMAEVLMNVDP